MRLTLPLDKAPVFILEERLGVSPHNVNHAWTFDTKDEALDALKHEVSIHGHERFYTVYVHIED